MRLRGALVLWGLLILLALGAAALTGDLIIAAGRFWFVTGPLLLAYAAFIFLWGTAPAKTADEGQTAKPEASPMGLAGQLVLRLVLTVIIVAASLFALGIVLYLIQLALEHLEYSIPFAVVAGVLVLMAIWPSKTKRAPPILKGESKAEADATIVGGGEARSDDIVT